MIYLRLHQARNEEIEAETSWMWTGICRMQAGANRGNFARIAKFSLCTVISLHSEFSLYREISLHSEIFTCSEISVPLFFVQTILFLVFSMSTLTVIILFRIDWYFHLFVRLYKPFYEHFVTLLLIEGISITGPCFGPHLLSSLSSFSHFLGNQTHPLRMKTQRMFG